MSGYLIDTSIFVAAERAAKLVDPPDGEARISVATLTELSLGVRRARSEELRRLREHTLARARSFVALPYDEPVAEVLAELVEALTASKRKAVLMDAIIASTAIVRGLGVWTADRDFLDLAKADERLRVTLV